VRPQNYTSPPTNTTIGIDLNDTPDATVSPNMPSSDPENSPISNSVEDELGEIEQELESLFRPYGLIHKIHVFSKENFEGILKNSAFVVFYSVMATRKAQIEVNGTTMRGKKLRVRYSTSKNNERDGQEFDLPIAKCIELANHYLGFNGWSSHIIAWEKLEEPSINQEGQFHCVFRCVVRHTLTDGRFVEAVGEGKTLGPDRGSAINNSKKIALSQARKNAFKRMVLILLGSGKVAVHMMGNPLPENYRIEPIQQSSFATNAQIVQ